MNDLRLPYYELSADAMKGLRSVKSYLEKSSLGLPLIELVYMRISQMNGCAYCLDMHGKALRKHGETDNRLDLLAGWRATDKVFTDRERAALEWAESVTNIAATRAGDESYFPLKEYFSDTEISDLTFAIALMNALNRMAISMRQ